LECAKCQFENPEGIRFCGACGHELIGSKKAQFKLHGQPYSYTPKFLADKILTTRTAIEGERKVVTVLFADVVNSTFIGESLNPEEVHNVMDGCFKILLDEVHKYEGTINQFMGDGVMALFGAPLAHEDHAQRACYAALGIQSAIKEFSEKIEQRFGLEFKMRIGLNSGPVVVGSIGDDLRMDYTAVGDTTNLASRMESMARPGSILVSKNVYNKVNPYFEFLALGKVSVKGKRARMEVYQLKAEIAKRQLRLERKIYSDLVDREKELNKLEAHVSKAINGEGSIVNVIGEPGIGKSRLIEELMKRSVIKKVALFEGRALAIGKNLSFHPIIDILKSWAGISKEDTEAEYSKKLERAIRGLYPSETEDVLPFIAPLMGLTLTKKYGERVEGLEGEALEKLILKSIRDLISKGSDRSPIVFILEDLQWADLTTIEFLESLFRLAADHRILFINVLRPGYAETADRLLESIRTRYSRFSLDIFLEPLNEHHSEVLIKNLMGVRVAPSPIITEIVRRCEGNPFFIEEVVQSFIDQGIVELLNGALTVTEKFYSLSIPETIQDVLAARIDRLDEKTKDLLKMASVMGRTFFYKVLVEVAKPITDIDERLEVLKEAQLICERERVGETEYFFKHGLIQEVTYESTLLHKRKAIHLNVAEAIESVFADRLRDFYGILAYHYSSGGFLVKAEDYLVKAGEEALRSSASTEALSYYQEALRIYLDLRRYEDTPNSDKLSMLEKNIGLALFNKGQYADALKYLDRVLERWGLVSPKNRLNIAFRLVSDLLSMIMNLYLPSGRLKRIPNKRENEIFTMLEKKLIVLAFLEPRRFFVEFLMALRWSSKLDITKIQNGVSRYSGASALFSWTGISFRLSTKILDHVKELINKNDSKEVLDYRLFKLYYDFFTGHWSGYEEIDKSLLELNLKVGQTWQVSTFIFFLCSIKIDQGHFREAKELIGRLSEIWEAYENENTLEYIHSLKVRTLLKLRKPRDARVEVDEALSFATRTRRDLAIVFYTGLKAISQILFKDFEGARELLAQAKDLLSKESQRIPYFIASYLLGQFLFDLYQLENAILLDDTSRISEYGKKAFKSGKLALKNSRKLACDRTEVFRLMGLYCWLTNSQNKAIGWWCRSMAEGERLGDRVELARTHMEIGKRLLEKKSRLHGLDGVEPEAYLEKARIPFEQMGLDWDLDELDKMRAFSKLSPL
jgi:class 3 adenylate cyclase/tetratricopeptide (TPR) repeat protein